MKRFLALILALTLVLSMLPLSALAEEYLIQEETLPEETIPEETVPEETILEETIPEETVPEETIPEETIPEETIPEETIPEETIPEETIPEEVIPEETIPEETTPEETIPEDTEEQAPALRSESVPESIFADLTDIEEQGKCGDNVYWAITEKGVFYVRGTGAMTSKRAPDYSCPYYRCRYAIREVIIEDGVTAISGGAFERCTYIKKVTIPDSVTSIGVDAFYGTGIQEIHIPEGVTVIESYAFASTPLTSIVIPDSVTSIESYAFSHTRLNAVTIPEGVTSIGRSAFYGSDLKTVAIPSSLATIGSGAFRDCTSLQGVYITDVSAWCKIEFEDTESNPLFVGNILYLNGDVVTDLEIPEGTTKINRYAFYGSDITSLKIPGSVTQISVSAFRESVRLESVVFSEGLTVIGQYAFLDCESLETVQLPNTVKTLGYNAFQNCTSLKEVTLSNSVQEIGEKTFENCTALESIVIPESVQQIGYYAFYGCTNLTEVQFPETLITVYNHAFDGCTALEKVVLHDNLQTIGQYAFNECTGLKKIEIAGGSLTKIDEYAFNGCVGLQSVKISGDAMETIGKYAFYGCESLQTVTLPEQLTTMGEGAFAYCTSLAQMEIPDGLTAIPAKAFSACLSLQEVIISEDVTTIGEEAFVDCISLRTIDLPDTITTIGNYAFCECVSLTQITLPSSLTSLGEGALAYCTSLTTLEIPSGVKRLNQVVFYGDVSLVSITLPAGLKSIGNMALDGCGSLNHILHRGAQALWTAVSVDESNDEILEDLIVHHEATGDEVTAGVSDTGVYASCSACGGTIEFGTIDISKCVAHFVNPYVEYTGSYIRPELYVIGPGGVILEKGVDYKVSYKNNKSIGTAQAVITGIGDYTGSTTLSFAINVPQVKNLRITSVASKSFKIAFNKVKGADKYAIYADGELYAVTSGNTYTLKVRQSGNGYDVYVVALKKAGEYYYASIPSEEISGRAYNHISKYNIKLDYTETVYNGRAKKPGYSSTEGLERTIVYENNIEIGTATVTITGRGQYGGTVKKTFKILPDQVKNLNVEMLSGSSVNISFDPVLGATEYWIYRNGERVKKITETSYTMTGLSAGKTYKFYVKANTPVDGENYTGAASETVSVKPIYRLEDCSVTLKYDARAYTGKAVTNTATVKNPDGKALKKDTDYKVSYENNKEMGIATMIITGKGKYAGQINVNYVIGPKQVEDVKLEVLSGTSVRITYGEMKGADEYLISVNGSDWAAVTGTEYVMEDLSPGTKYTVTVSAGVLVDDVMLHGEPSDSVSITPKHSLEICSVSLSQYEFAYTGSYQRPTVTVYGYNGEELMEGEDYTLSFKNNKYTGKAYVEVKGKGDYTGSVKEYYAINPAQVTGLKVSSTTKNSVKISFTKASSNSTKYYNVYVDGQEVGRTTSSSYTIKGLELGKTYSVYVVGEKTVSGTTYYGAPSEIIEVRPGTYIGGYKATLDFTKATFTGEAHEPVVTVKTSSKSSAKTLVQGEDYEVIYENNTAIGTAKVIITGIGQYAGTITKTFKINPPKVENVAAVAASNTSIEVSFDAAPGATSYWVYVDGEREAKITETTCVIKGLKKNKTYKITVKAVATVDGENYTSDYTDPVSCKTVFVPAE